MTGRRSLLRNIRRRKSGLSLTAHITNQIEAVKQGWPGLRFDVLDAIIAKVGDDLPLVLHGGSGIPDAMVQEAPRHS